MSFEYHLDRRVSTGVIDYPGEDPHTEFWVPYLLPLADTFRCVATDANGSYRAGQLVPFSIVREEAGRTLIRAANVLPSFVFGRSYEMRYRFSTLLIREEATGGGQQPVTEGRLQIRRLTVSHAVTGYYRAEVQPSARAVFTYPFTGRRLGDARAPLGSFAADTGTFAFAVAAKNDEVTIDLVNDTHNPSTFLGASWEGFYVSRSRRI